MYGLVVATNLGFPRIGPNRELKRAMESYWANQSTEEQLLAVGAQIKGASWRYQASQGISHIPSNDFSLYDHVLDTTVMVGAIPERYGHERGEIFGLDTYFAMARGRAGTPESPGVPAMEMTKWFDTNYHYIVPEFEPRQSFYLNSTKPVDEFLEAAALGIRTRPVILGPVTYLMLGKMASGSGDPLALLENLLPVYEDLLKRLAEAGAQWVQLDEPTLGLTLNDEQRASFGRAYARLSASAPTLKLLVAVYFSDLRENLRVARALPVAGLHIDAVRGPDQLGELVHKLPDEMVLSIGIVDGRNIWKTNLAKAIETVNYASAAIGGSRILVGPSCSLIHSPVDLNNEQGLDAELKSWMAFAKQKVNEIVIITRAVNKDDKVKADLEANAKAMRTRRTSARIHNANVRSRVESIDDQMLSRNSEFDQRANLQKKSLRLPEFPTTTIGSFPQTSEIRRSRAAHSRGDMSDDQYETFIKEEIERVIRFQESVGLDVLVHGEPERNDMVEYFGEQIVGYTSTKTGWVQSYGSRCVKPPIIFGDINRPNPMTVAWTSYAQSLTDRPVKGMLTGPVTMLQWSFVRDDIPRSETCKQLALAIRDEVGDLERAGIRVIQVDEPALREGLPLRREDWEEYLSWAVDSFRISSAGVEDSTQVHTHMCYAAYDDIIDAVAAMDADVISMENSRSDGSLLATFHEHPYPNEIGPGVYDIHSPRVVQVGEVKDMLDKALAVIPATRLWVNPDCGLKTRGWPEVQASLEHMVEAARAMR